MVPNKGHMVILSHVDKEFTPEQVALRDVTFRISQGEFVFVAGPSGAGKSTLLKLLFAAEDATRGKVFIGGKDLSSLSVSDISRLRRGIGVVFQDYKLLPSLTAIENVAFALEVVGVRRANRFDIANRMLSALGLEKRLDAYPEALSGGEQQRVSLARALINRPRLILADEPTGNLDPMRAKAVIDILQQVNRCGTTIIVASHDQHLIERMNKRTLIIEEGRIVGDFVMGFGRG